MNFCSTVDRYNVFLISDVNTDHYKCHVSAKDMDCDPGDSDFQRYYVCNYFILLYEIGILVADGAQILENPCCI